MYEVSINNFEDWRQTARMLLDAQIPPSQIEWREKQGLQASLLGENFIAALPVNNKKMVPKEFIDLARKVSCHRKLTKWPALYTVLWRITQGEKHLLKISTDSDMRTLLLMRKAVGRDVHKMTAFVRFQLVKTEIEPIYAAWYEPDHKILNLAAPYFYERFKIQNWIIFTPDGFVAWNGKSLHFNDAPMKKIEFSSQDQMEFLWQTYYRAIFNPARIKIAAMKREMPVRFWKNLPETELIHSMLSEAPQRVIKMIKASGILSE